MPRNIATWSGTIEVHTVALFTFTQTVCDTRKKSILNYGFLVSYVNVLVFAWYFLYISSKSSSSMRSIIKYWWQRRLFSRFGVWQLCTSRVDLFLQQMTETLILGWLAHWLLLNVGALREENFSSPFCRPNLLVVLLGKGFLQIKNCGIFHFKIGKYCSSLVCITW